MACTIIISGTKYTEKQFKSLLKSGLLYNSMERGLVTLPVEVGVITKPDTEQTKFRRNFPFSKEDVVLAMINIFGLSNKEAKANAEIADAMAGEWARRNNKTKEDFYKTLVYIKPSTQQIEVTPNLLFAGLNEFNFRLTAELEERKNFVVSKNGEDIGKVEIDVNANGEYYVSFFMRRKSAGSPGDGSKMIKVIMQNLMAQGFPVAIDTAITQSGFAAMERLVEEGFLIKVGEEIKPTGSSFKPMDYETPPFIINPKVIPKVTNKNKTFLFQETLKDSAYTPTEVTQLSKEKEVAKAAAIKNGTFLKAPNGKDTNLTEDQWLTVQTPTFKNWFGDSKVLDDNGEPKVMYHGTNNEFSEFSEEKRKGLAQYNGIFVSPEIFFAEDYSTTNVGRILELFAKSSNPFDYDNPAHVKLATEAGLSMTEVSDPTKDSNWAILERGTFQKFIQENNFDGYYTKEDGVKNIAVYKSNQLKVSDGRNQTFLEGSKNIFYQQGASQVIASVVKGFGLEQNPKGFGLAFNTKNQKATPELASRINTWMAQNNLSGVKFYYEKLYGTINAIVQPQSNMLFQIIGEKGASNLNNKVILENLGVARVMEEEGNSARGIRYATGWERGADKKWKYEILDGKLITDGLKKLTETKINLVDIYDNPLLYEAYPILKTIKVDSTNIQSGAAFNLDTRTIEISYREQSTEEIRLSLLHEIQHAIQSIEGFANGGSITARWAAITNIQNDFKNAIENNNWQQLYSSEEVLLKSIVKKYFKDEGVVFSDLSKSTTPLLKNRGIILGVETGKITRIFGKDIKEMLEYPKGIDFYIAIKGEVEARNVTTRDILSEEERRQKMLSDTEDVARESQIYIDLGDNSGLYNEYSLPNNLLNQQAQAAILIGQDVADIIYALNNPNVSSPVHELAHKWEKELTEEERNQVLDFAKENNVDIANGWTREVSEAFARGFEKYLAEGIAPTPGLEKLFKQFAEWLTTIYKGIVGSEIDINLNDDMRKIYATMLGENFETTVKEEVAAEQAVPVVEEVAAAPIEEVTEPTEVEEVPDNLSWRTPISETTQDIEAKKQSIKVAYDNKSFDEALNSGTLSLEEVEDIITSAGLPITLVDNILFRMTNPETTYSVLGLLDMKINAVFQQVANYFIETGLISSAIDSDIISTSQAKELLDKIIPSYKSEAFDKLKGKVDTLWNAILKEQEDLKADNLIKKNGFEVGQFVLYQGTKYEIIDEDYDGNRRFAGFVLKNPLTNKGATVKVPQIKEWTEELEKEYKTTLRVEELKRELGEEAPKKEELANLKQDARHTNIQHVGFADVKDKGVSAQSFAQILNISRKFAAMFPFMNIQIGYAEDATKGSVFGNTVRINLKNATQDTPIHELLHPFMVVLKLENPKLYNNLLKEFRANTPVYNTWLEDVRDNSFYAIQEVEVQEEEAFIQYLGEVIASLHDAKGNFIDPVVFVTKVQKKAKQDDIFVDETVEEDLDNLSEEELDARAIAEASDLVSEEVVDGKTQEFYEELGYKATGEVSSTVGVEGRKFTKIKMVHPKVAEITSGFIKNFYKWFLDILKSLTPQTKSGRKIVRFSDLNLAEIDPKTETVKFFKPAKNRAERVDKVEVFDEDGNVTGTEKVKTQRRDDKPSFTLSFSEVRESLSKRGASESEISNLINQIESHYNDDYTLSVSLEDSYVPVKDNLTNSNDTKNEESSFFSTDRKLLDVTELPVSMTINDLATLFSFAGDRIMFDFTSHVDALSELEAYQYTNNDIAKDLIERTEKRVKILTATDARIGIESSPTVKSESFAVKELLNKYKDVQFIEAYVRQGISALADAAKMIKYIKEAIKDGEATDEVMNQTLNRDLREAQALMSFYDDVASLIEKNEKMFEQEDLDYFNSIMTRATSRRREINSILVDLITEWLFPTISGSQKNIDTKEALTKEEFKKNVRAATSDVNLVSYFGQAPVNSRDPLMAALAIKVKDELNKNYREEENSLQRLRVLYDDFLKATGISNTTKAVEEYYKANFLRKAKVWELVAIEKGGVKKYDYVERWAFHEEYLADVHAEARRQEIERLKNQLGEPNNYDERLIFNERLAAWDNANPLQSAKFRNPAFSNLKSNEYYMFLYDMYKKANDKYADRRLDFGIIPQAYNSPNALEKAKKVAQYTTEVLKGDKKAASKLKELGVSAANAIFDKNSFEKVQALNLDGSYHMSVKSPFTHLLDEQFLSFRLNESVYGFSTSANAYNTLRSNQANVENLKLLINGNVKLGIEARKVLKSKIKTRDGITSSEMVWDVLEGMPPQDKEQSAKLISKQMNAYINDTFYGVTEIGGEFSVGPVVINVNKIADNLGFFTALLNMAGNVIAGVSNITVGNAMSLGEAFGGKFYTPKDWAAAQGIYFKEFLTGKFMADAIDPVKSKITQLGIMHDAIQGEFRDKYGKNITGNVLQRYFTKDTLFIINHIAEHQIQLTGMLALMNSTKVKLKDGSEVNLYDAYVKNDKGFYKLREDATWSEKQQQEFIRTLHGISRDLNGNYAAYDKAMIQRYALGKLALQYRKYLYTAWRSRFASKRYDYEKGTTQEGYYRAFLKALYADIKEFNLSSLTRTLIDPRLSNRELTDEQKYAIRKTRYDIIMVVGLTMLSTMLATAEAEAPDDDEDNYWRQLLLLVSLRLRSDLSSYSITAPQELHKILTNPSASFNTITKFTEFLGQLTNDIQNGQFETYERRTGNNEAGDLKVVGKFEKLLPVYRQWLRLQNPEDQLKYYDLINKNVKPSN